MTLIPDANSLRAGRAVFSLSDDGRQDLVVSTSIADELHRLAKAADEWRKLRGWSRTRFCEQFSNLTGDRKTFGELADKSPDKWERQPANWIESYRRLPQALREFESRSEDAPLLELPHVHIFGAALAELRRQTSEKRALFVEGVSGAGKSALLTQMQSILGEDRVIMIRGRQSWSSFSVMLECWLAALGKPAPDTRRHVSASRLQERVGDALRSAGDVVIAVDEAHCIPGPGLNALRDWINDAHQCGTRVHFVLAAIPTLWNSLTGRYKDESMQFVRRFSDRVEITPPDAAECLRLLGQWIDISTLEGQTEAAGRLLAGHAVRSGSRSYIRDVRAAARQAGRAFDFGRLKEIAAAVAHKNR